MIQFVLFELAFTKFILFNTSEIPQAKKYNDPH